MLLKSNITLQLKDLISDKTFTVEPNHLVIIKYDMIYKAPISAFDQHVIDLYHVTSLDEDPSLRRIKIEEVPLYYHFDIISK